MRKSLPDERKHRKSAFTLVELVVVITILAILGTIGFLSIQGYSKSARDSTRISDLANLARGFETAIAAGKTLPLPDANMLTITASGTTIGYQGYAGSNVLRTLGLGGKFQDPNDHQYYTYATTANQNKYQILGLLENSDTIAFESPIVPNAYAGYETRFPSTKGSALGILLGTGTTLNQPVQEGYSIASFTGVDLATTNTNYTAWFGNKETTSGTGGTIFAGIYGRRSELVKVKALARHDTSLVAHWTFDESSGGETYDNSRSSFTGNLVSTTWKPGKIGNSIDSASGVTGYMYAPSRPALNFGTGSFSVSMWGLYRDFTYPKAGFMIKKADRCYQPGYPGWGVGHGYHANGISVCYSDGTNGATENLINFDAGYRPNDIKGQWNNLTVVFDLNQKLIFFYVNGKKQTATHNISGVTGSVNNTQDILVGTMHGFQMDGQVDEVRMYNRALSETEALTIYEASK